MLIADELRSNDDLADADGRSNPKVAGDEAAELAAAVAAAAPALRSWSGIPVAAIQAGELRELHIEGQVGSRSDATEAFLLAALIPRAGLVRVDRLEV